MLFHAYYTILKKMVAKLCQSSFAKLCPPFSYYPGLLPLWVKSKTASVHISSKLSPLSFMLPYYKGNTCIPPLDSFT